MAFERLAGAGKEQQLLHWGQRLKTRSSAVLGGVDPPKEVAGAVGMSRIGFQPFLTPKILPSAAGDPVLCSLSPSLPKVPRSGQDYCGRSFPNISMNDLCINCSISASKHNRYCS